MVRFIKFCLVGGSGTLLNMGLLWLFTEFAGFPYLISAVIGIETSIITNYILHSYITFADRRASSRKIFFKRLLKYNLASLGGMAINIGVLWLLTEVAGLYYLLSHLCGIALSTLWRYFISLKWAWQQPE